MRYRRLDADQDYVFGHGAADFLVDSPQAVAQAVLTTLRLVQGEWFLNMSDGVPYPTQILGNNTQATRDQAMKTAILGVPGVTSIVTYASQFNRFTRAFTLQALILTAYSTAPVPVSL